MFLKLSLLTLTYLLVVSAGIFSQEASAKEKCDYDHDIRTYLCKHVTSVFPSIYYGNYHLKCEGCFIQIFKRETFPFDNNLVSMNLTNNGIRNISSHAFEKLTTLQYIYLQHNKIVNVSANAFFAMRQVYELHLEYNSLSELTPLFMNGFEANTIIISHNELTDIPAHIFEGIFGVMTLDLSNNKISTLHHESFNHLQGLEYLDLKHNKLCNIPLGTFKHLRLLKELNLAYNHFKKFQCGIFSGLPNLSLLNISHNSLIEFEPSMLIPLISISTLDISGNGLNYMDPVMFVENAPSLRLIGVSDNLWTCTALVNLVRYLKSVHMDVIEHNKYEVTNIKGIACTEKVVTDEKIPFKTFYKIAQEFTRDAYTYC